MPEEKAIRLGGSAAGLLQVGSGFGAVFAKPQSNRQAEYGCADQHDAADQHDYADDAEQPDHERRSLHMVSKLPILIVDDDPDGGPILAKLLSAWGFEADVARNGFIALQMVENKQYGLAIIDYLMPGMNGVELLQKMRAHHSDLAAIFLTGYTTIDVVFPAFEAGVLRVLSKPADFKELLPIIEEHLGVKVSADG
ncbi:MAG TPA: response regulator [Pirellulales bacterium]|nr:response regulator [Pirellulales bacterium]